MDNEGIVSRRPVQWMNMEPRVFYVRSTVLGILVLSALLVWCVPTLGYAKSEVPFSITFLNVGQGDAILVETPDGIDLLIDGGPGGAVLAELAAVLGAFDRTIDMVVATHPDADHIGGLVDVLERYEVGSVVMTENESETAVNDSFRDAVAQEGAEIIYAREGQTFSLGAEAMLTILFPQSDASTLDSNESSIVAKLSYGEIDVLLTGDAPKAVEAELLSVYGDSLHSEILKLGHHGSRTSTGEAFLKAVDPIYGIVSAAKDSRYGHPHEEVVDLVLEYGANLRATKDGRITFVSDGHTLEER